MKDLKSLTLMAMTTALTTGPAIAADENNQAFSIESAFQDSTQQATYRVTGCCQDPPRRRTYDSGRGLRDL